MAETLTPRIGLTDYSAGTDAPSRADFNRDNAALEALAVIGEQGLLAARPPASAARARALYFATDAAAGAGRLYYCTGAAWIPLGPSIGSVQFFLIAPPAGWLTLDGGAYSRTAAGTSELWAAAAGSPAFGPGDGLTTFTVPNMRGRFPIGLDPAVPAIDALGEAGGALGHTHGTQAHTHSGPSHVHGGPSHSHDPGNHTHAMAGNVRTFGAGSDNHTHFGVVPGGGSTAGVNDDHTHDLGGITTGGASNVNTGAAGTGNTDAGGTGATGQTTVGGSTAADPPFRAGHFAVKA